MEVIAIINRKGGVGKTATAQALGQGLLRRKKKVLYIDLDSQCNLSYTLTANTEGATILDLLTGANKPHYIQRFSDVGHIIAGSENLAAADTLLTGTGKEYKLREAIEPLKKDYDYIIIDTPAALGTLTVNALTAADSVIIPVQADVYSLQGIEQLHEAIEAVKRYCNPSLYIRGILCTRYNGRAVLSRDMLDNLKDAAKELNTCVYSTPIRECIAIKEAAATQTDIYTYAPKSNAAQDYEQFVKEFLKQR